jgi:hypothetical protein
MEEEGEDDLFFCSKRRRPVKQPKNAAYGIIIYTIDLSVILLYHI